MLDTNFLMQAVNIIDGFGERLQNHIHFSMELGFSIHMLLNYELVVFKIDSSFFKGPFRIMEGLRCVLEFALDSF